MVDLAVLDFRFHLSQKIMFLILVTVLITRDLTSVFLPVNFSFQFSMFHVSTKCFLHYCERNVLYNQGSAERILTCMEFFQAFHYPNYDHFKIQINHLLHAKHHNRRSCVNDTGRTYESHQVMNKPINDLCTLIRIKFRLKISLFERLLIEWLHHRMGWTLPPVSFTLPGMLSPFVQLHESYDQQKGSKATELYLTAFYMNLIQVVPHPFLEFFGVLDFQIL